MYKMKNLLCNSKDHVIMPPFKELGEYSFEHVRLSACLKTCRIDNWRTIGTT